MIAADIERAVNQFAAYRADGFEVDVRDFLGRCGITVVAVEHGVIVTSEVTVKRSPSGGWYVEPQLAIGRADYGLRRGAR